MQREDLSQKVEQQKQAKEMDKEEERDGESMASPLRHTVFGRLKLLTGFSTHD